MKVIDARTGQQVVVNQTVDYGDGERATILAIEPGLFTARARIRMTYRDHSKPGAPLVTTDTWGPLQVRWTHPRFFLEHVAFIPS